MKSYRIALVLLSGAMVGSVLAAPAAGSAATAVLEGKQRLAEIRSRVCRSSSRPSMHCTAR